MAEAGPAARWRVQSVLPGSAVGAPVAAAVSTASPPAHTATPTGIAVIVGVWPALTKSYMKEITLGESAVFNWFAWKGQLHEKRIVLGWFVNI